VESGTSLGQGVDAALNAGFDLVYTIELSERYYQNAVEKYRTESRVILLQGDSGDVLNVMAPEFREPVVFFLDAHHSAADSAQGRDLCPVLRELQAIGKSPIKTHTILVDDFHALGIPCEVVRAAVLEINPNYQIEVWDVVQGDGSVTKDGMLVARIA
jgi:hypothetical protein